MKRERPPMPPLSVRVQVAERQLLALNPDFAVHPDMGGCGTHLPSGKRLEGLLRALRYVTGWEEIALDHDPALILRDYNPRRKKVADRYTPHAHDPAHLSYREKADHHRKTFGRKPGAAKTVTTKGSDIWLKSKFNRLEGRTKQRPKQKIPQRKHPWPKKSTKARF